MTSKTLFVAIALVLCATGTAGAAIVYDSFSGIPKTYTLSTSGYYNAEFLGFIDLPGAAQIDVLRTSAGPRQLFQLVNTSVLFSRYAGPGTLYYFSSLPLNGVWTGIPPANLASWGNVSGVSGTTVDQGRSNPTYIPFQFTDSGTKYGYLALSTNLSGTTFTMTIDAVAYDTSGAQIAMGAAAPEPGTLISLLPGLAGLMAWRRRRV